MREMIEVSSSPQWISHHNRLSSPKWLLLSPMDVQMPICHVPLLLAYRSSSPSDFSSLKIALQQVLDRYPELSGRIQPNESGNLAVLLSNDGVYWVEALATETLDEFLTRDHEDLHMLAPMFSSEPDTEIPLLIQITGFRCGGFSIGMRVQHQIVDCNSFPVFLADWAAVARGAILPPPSSARDRSSLMPRDPPRPEFKHPEYDPPSPTFTVPQDVQSITTHRILFSRGELDRLKREGRNSTFVALAAHLWRLITIARKVDSESQTILMCPVNGRRGLSLPVDYFGNGVFRSSTGARARDLVERSLEFGASIVRASLDRASETDRLRSVIDFLAVEEKSSARLQFVGISFDPNLVITSWARLPLYEIDFGSGAPILATPTNGPCEGYVRVVPSGLGDGSLVAIPTLRTETMKMLLSLVEESRS